MNRTILTKLIAPFLAISALTLVFGLVGNLQSNVLYKQMIGKAPAAHGGTPSAAETRLNKLVDINATVAASATRAATTRKILSLSALVAGVALALFLGFFIAPLPARKPLPSPATSLSEWSDQDSLASQAVPGQAPVTERATGFKPNL